MKKYFEVGFHYTYSERHTTTEIVYGTKEQDDDYLDKLIKQQPKWLQNQVTAPNDRFVRRIGYRFLG